MKLTLLAAAVLALAAGKKPAPESTDPNHKVAAAHGGKVWVSVDTPTADNGDTLASWLSSHPASARVKRKSKEGPWSINYVAIFALLKVLALEGWESSQLFPIYSVGVVAVSAMLALLLFRERLSKRKTLGLAVGVVAVALLNQ